MATSQSSMEHDALRNRVVSLEALLHEAAKSRDEAAVLRSKVAELDGRLGTAMKAMAEARTRKPENEPV
jgi:BMFP domain-containing protein YqiC